MSLHLRMPCEHDRVGRVLTDAEALLILLEAHRDAIDDYVAGWDEVTDLVAAVAADEEEGDDG